MAVAFDAKSGLNFGTVSSGGGTDTSLLTVGASATFLLFGFEVDTATPGTPTATWDTAGGGTNQAMTQIGSTLTLAGPTPASLALFGLVNPTSGLKNLTFSMGTASVNVYSFGISFTGTATSSVAAAVEGFASNNANTSSTLSVTTSASVPSGDMAVAFGIDSGGGFTNATTENLGGTQIGENENAINNGVAAYFSGAGSTITASAGLTGSDVWGALIVGIKAPGGAAATTIGWSRPNDPERPLLPPQRNDWASQWFIRSPNPVPTNRYLPTTGEDVERLPPLQRTDWAPQWFVRSPNPVPTRWLPVTGQEDRPPPPSVRPDDSSIETPQYFARSPNPVPTRWLPTTGQEDRPPNPNRIRAPDEPFSWFVRSPAPVPITWIPQWDGWERPKRVDLDPAVTVYGKPPAAVQNTIAGMAWFNPPETRPPPIIGDPAVVQAFPPFIEPPLIPCMAGSFMEEYHPIKPILQGDYGGTTFFRPPFSAPVPISGIAWWRPADDVRLVPGRGVRPPDEAFPWFVRSPNPVPITWLPTAHTDGDYPPPVKFEDRLPAFAPKAPAPPVGISGMAWFMPPEQIPRFDVTITDQHWSPSWAPQIVIQLAPTTKPEWIIRARRRARR